MEKFDLIIIGGGAGAFASAIKANELGAKTAIINDGLPLGGTCVNVGCVPSKILLYASELLHQTKHHGIPGVELEIKKFNFSKIIAHELSLVKKMRMEKYEQVLKNLKNVTLIKGKAKFISNTKIKINERKITADKFIIATGSTANIPNIKGLKETGYLTHIEALKLNQQPKKMVILGAGAIALEFSQMFARFGTKVTLLHRNETILKTGDQNLVNQLIKILTNEKITIKTNASIIEVKKKNNKKIITYQIKNKQTKIICDKILLATGKTANTQNLGLNYVGVKTNQRHSIIVNKYFQTSNPNIFAIGDVIALPLRLETTAGKEGTLATENLLKNTQNQINYNTVPYTIFTDPQLASVGLTEIEQIKQMKTCACRTISFKNIPKGIITHRTEGLITMNIHPKTKEITGVHILAPHAGDLIAEAMILIKNKNTINDITESLPIFPTLSEAIKIVATSFTKDISKLSCCI